MKRKFTKNPIECSESVTQPREMPEDIAALFSIRSNEAKFNDDPEEPYTDEFFIDIFVTLEELLRWMLHDFGQQSGPYPEETINAEFTGDELNNRVHQFCQEHNDCEVVYVEESGDGVGIMFSNPYWEK